MKDPGLTAEPVAHLLTLIVGDFSSLFSFTFVKARTHTDRFYLFGLNYGMVILLSRSFFATVALSLLGFGGRGRGRGVVEQGVSLHQSIFTELRRSGERGV